MAGPLDGRTAVRFGAVLKKHLTFEVEFFPKQGTLNENRKFGNLIKLPLGVHRKYGLRSVFFSICDDGLKFIDGVKENLSVPQLCSASRAGRYCSLCPDFGE